MRTFHRWVGFPASLFLVIIGGTGVYLLGCTGLTIYLKMFSQRARAGTSGLVLVNL